MIKRFLRGILNAIMESVFVSNWLIQSVLYHKKTSKIEVINDNIIVVGNGPSVNDFDFESALNKEYEFLCVNFFALDEVKFFQIRPKYYCIVDPSFYSESTHHTGVQMKKLYEILNRVEWDFTMISLGGQVFKSENKNIKNIRINTYLYRGKSKRIAHVLYKKNMATYGYQNVISAALFFLVTAKAKSVFLTGVDNDWHRELYVNEDNDVMREDRHFYGTNMLNVTKIGEIGKGELYKYFYWYYITLFQYHEASMYAQWRKVPIYNCCPRSYIDVFEKIKWGEQESLRRNN